MLRSVIVLGLSAICVFAVVLPTPIPIRRRYETWIFIKDF